MFRVFELIYSANNLVLIDLWLVLIDFHYPVLSYYLMVYLFM